MRFGILSQWFDPEPGGGAIPGALARALASRGHEVTVLTGFPNYPNGEIYPGYSMRPKQDSWQDGVRLRRVALYPSHDTSSAHRVLNYGSFALSATTLGLPVLRGLDAIWVYNSPASIAAPMWAAKYLLGIPHVLHVMDLWPDSIFLSNFGSRSLSRGLSRRALDKWCSAMYHSAATVAYVTPGLQKELASRGVPKSKLHYVPVWADELVSKTAEPMPRSTWGVGDSELLMLYAGALGAAQGLDSLIEGLALIREKVRVTCLLAGSGTAAASLQALARDRGLDNVRFLGQVPRDQMPGIMAAADLHVVTLKKTPLSLITMPSKIQTTLASGKPFIAALSGDAREVAVQSGAGITANPGDPESMAQAITTAAELGQSQLALKGLAGRAHYRDTYALDIGVDRIESLLIGAAELRKPRNKPHILRRR
jgi:colanic acid biosynthesis glycosyl transferase WcaI